ncbi:uncharacterized protein PAC_18773 [Phialocephala subalpina]|uniref:Uncharacterized protein n=1 Tax=Phialocephala subalpina TaxID=576137 RepID=A0A1L7XUZ8_9HELO|nr:uncharacterized protein PAC_18773 [Phialocephala subalpina]
MVALLYLWAKTPKDKNIRLWNIATKETVQTINNDGFLFKLSFSDDGSKLETNREILFWFPPGYAPRGVAFEDDVLAIGHSEGRVTFMEFFPDAVPLRRRIDPSE